MRLPLPAPLLAAWLLALAPACDPPEPQAPGALRYAEDARKAYEKALEAFLDRDWEEARPQLLEVRRKYAYSQYARLAEQRLADIDYEQEKFAAAITSYRAYVTDHPSDEGVPYARFRITKALYAQISDTILLPSQEERDQAAILDAYRELSAFLAEYPSSKWTPEAQFMLVTVTGRLVRHELYVARYYLKRDNFDAAAARIKYALDHYDGSGLEAEALVLLAETYMKMKHADDAKKELRRVLEFYPASPFVVPARAFLVALGEAPPPPTPVPALPPASADPAGSPPTAPPPLF